MYLHQLQEEYKQRCTDGISWKTRSVGSGDVPTTRKQNVARGKRDAIKWNLNDESYAQHRNWRKEFHIKELQNKFRQTNKIAADKRKGLGKLKRSIVPEEQDIMLSWGRKSPSLGYKNDIPSTENKKSRGINSLASDRGSDSELSSCKTCVKTARNSGTHQKMWNNRQTKITESNSRPIRKIPTTTEYKQKMTIAGY